MRKIGRRFGFVTVLSISATLVCGLATVASAQLQVTPLSTTCPSASVFGCLNNQAATSTQANQLATSLMGTAVTLQSATIQGAQCAAGSFKNGSEAVSIPSGSNGCVSSTRRPGSP